MTSNRRSLLPVALTVSGLLSITNAFAVPTFVTFVEDPNGCDPLFGPHEVDEIGETIGGFPVGERLASAVKGQGPPVCTSSYAGGSNPIVAITNLNTVAFTEVWYVADPETAMSNYDGSVVVVGDPFAASLAAFKIDMFGSNTPLLFESGAVDGVWSPGEIWHFVIQEYFNGLGLSPAALGSIGLGSPGGLSSGSIIGIPALEVVPVPPAVWLFGSALGVMGWLRRKATA